MSDGRERFPSEAAERFQVRLPDGMRDRIREAAAANGRSMNTEISARLEQSFATWPQVTLPSAIVERAMAATPEERAHFERKLSDLGTQIARSHFPPQGQDFLELYQAYNRAVEAVDGKEREDIRSAFDEAMERLMQELPEEVRAKAHELIDTEESWT